LFCFFSKSKKARFQFFENLQNKITVDSGVLKSFKELASFLKEPVLWSCSEELLLWVKPLLSFFLRITGQWSHILDPYPPCLSYPKKRTTQDWSIICSVAWIGDSRKMHLVEDITHLLMAVMVVVKPLELQEVSMLNYLDKVQVVLSYTKHRAITSL
jgi:hypothetical protein